MFHKEVLSKVILRELMFTQEISSIFLVELIYEKNLKLCICSNILQIRPFSTFVYCLQSLQKQEGRFEAQFMWMTVQIIFLSFTKFISFYLVWFDLGFQKMSEPRKFIFSCILVTSVNPNQPEIIIRDTWRFFFVSYYYCLFFSQWHDTLTWSIWLETKKRIKEHIQSLIAICLMMYTIG